MDVRREFFMYNLENVDDRKCFDELLTATMDPKKSGVTATYEYFTKHTTTTETSGDSASSCAITEQYVRGEKIIRPPVTQRKGKTLEPI